MQALHERKREQGKQWRGRKRTNIKAEVTEMRRSKMEMTEMREREARTEIHRSDR